MENLRCRIFNDRDVLLTNVIIDVHFVLFHSKFIPNKNVIWFSVELPKTDQVKPHTVCFVVNFEVLKNLLNQITN